MRTSIEEQLMNFAWIMLFDDLADEAADADDLELVQAFEDAIHKVSKRTVANGFGFRPDERWLLKQVGL